MRIGLLFTFVLLAGCARAPIKTPDQSMRLLDTPPSAFVDDMGFASLLSALEVNAKFLREKTPQDELLYFGPRQIAKSDYLRGLDLLIAEGKADPSGARFQNALKTKFDAYEVYGQEKWGEVLITSYFEPVIEGSLKRDKRFTQPIYGMPKDLVVVDLDSFIAARPELASLRAQPLEQRARQNILRGKLQPPGKDALPRVVAYADRAEIDEKGLDKQSKILAWVDPIDGFFLEIQGSGVVHLKNGKEIKVGYAGQNGHPYVPIGKHLLDVIPKEKLTMHSIESHLRGLPPEDARKIMELNPSYVFFQKLPNSGLSFLGTEVVGGRTIATDQSLFPKGALAYLEFEKPVFASSADSEPVSWQPSSRFVLDQDTGGAIRGPGRLDLFWGRGDEAKQAAGVMKKKGRLVYFVPKLEFLVPTVQ
jgi:membrane-bound lytic murein transglycosylase A